MTSIRHLVRHGCVLFDELSRGANGVVWRALDPSRGEVVAVKLLGPGEHEHDVRPGTLPVIHPHLLEIYRAGRGYLVMELADGGRSTDYLDARFGRSISPERTAAACRIGRQTALALAALHQHDLIHRDVKPSNVLMRLDPAGGVESFSARLADFDLVTTRGRSMAGVIQGTPAYMAPEQHGGRRVDDRADLFALGATLAQLVTGRAPFAVDPRGLHEPAKRAGRWLEPDRDSLVPSEVRPVIEGLLAPEARDRWPPTAAAVASELLDVGDDPVAGFVSRRIVGRERVLGDVAAAFERAQHGAVVLVLSGPRGSGRSAVLERAGCYADAKGWSTHRQLESVPRTPGLWLVDDADRLGLRERKAVTASARTLSLASSRLTGTVLMVAVASDSLDGREIADRLMSLGAERLELTPLDQPQVAQLLESCTLHPSDPEASDRLLRASGGLPAVIEPMVSGHEPVIDVGDLVRELDPPARRCLQMLALVRMPISARRLEIDDGSLTSLMSAGLIRSTASGQIVVGSEVLADALSGSITVAEKRHLAGAVRRLARPSPTSLLEMALVAAEGDSELVDRRLRTIGDELARTGEWSRALEILDRLDVEGDHPAHLQARIELVRARCCEALGRLPAAAVSAAVVLDLDPAEDAALVTEAALFAARVARSQGDSARSARLNEVARGRAQTARLVALEVAALVELGRPDEALSVAQEASESAAESRCRMAVGDRAFAAADIALASQSYRRAATIAAACDDDTVVALAFGRLGNLCYRLGRPGPARRWWEREVERWGESTSTQRIVTQHRFGLVCMDDEEPGGAAEHFRACARLCREVGDLERLVLALNGLLTAETNRLEIDAARSAGIEALEIACKLGDRHAEAMLRVNLAHLALLVGASSEVDEHSSAIERRAGELEDKQLEAIALRDRAALLARDGLIKPRLRGRARRLLERAADLLSESAAGSETALRIELDLCLLSNSGTAEVLRRVEHVRESARSAGMLGLDRLAEVGLVRLAVRSGELGRALQYSAIAFDHAASAPLGETTLLAHSARAAATGSLDDYCSYADTLDRVSHQLGDNWSRSFRARIDLAQPLVDAVGVAARRDLSVAQRLADRLSDCSALCWRADALIARAAAATGMVGVAIFRKTRARMTLRGHPVLEDEAALDPAARELLSVLE